MIYIFFLPYHLCIVRNFSNAIDKSILCHTIFSILKEYIRLLQKLNRLAHCIFCCPSNLTTSILSYVFHNGSPITIVQKTYYIIEYYKFYYTINQKTKQKYKKKYIFKKITSNRNYNIMTYFSYSSFPKNTCFVLMKY